jgi:hypothetical protein
MFARIARIARIVVLALALTVVGSTGVAAGVGAAAPSHVGHMQLAEGGFCC